MKSSRLRIGVLALQGAFHLHRFHIEEADADYVEVITPKDFSSIDGLIIPGGESSVMLKLIETVGIQNDLKSFFKAKPVWGICAGAILMAQKVNNPLQNSFNALPIEITRNAYGHQSDSFEEMINHFKVSFIRAPKIISIGENLKVLHTKEGAPTWVESDLHMATTFHPELDLKNKSPWHQRFVDLVGATSQRGRIFLTKRR